jgi:UDP-N-acetylglucosamine/UDP-N-acetylgalactosamine diphosphorylase
MVVIDEAAIRTRYEAAGQGHVWKHLEGLLGDDNAADKESLLKQLNGIQVEELADLYKSASAETKDDEDDVITPFSKTVGRSTEDAVSQDARRLGIEAISQGQVAALVLAGGQGTRLGFSGPKGMYDIGLPSGRTLFQLICERLSRLRTLAKTSKRSSSSSGSDNGDDGDDSNNTKLPSLPFYIMTSPINHDETVQFLEKNSFFGLPKDDVKCFQQGMLPCLTNEGKIILESASKVAMAPDGNGGIYPSLHKTGMLDDMKQRGIQHIHVFSIDNSLTKPADPVFVGYCISQKADCGNKVVWKADAHEKVGVIAERGGKPCVVEYSEITKEMAERTDDDDDNKNGRLLFGAGNICNHYYTLDFLQNTVLPNLGDMYHVARKKIPYYDEEKKETVTPGTNNGIKLESFIFDVFPLSERMAVLDVERAEEFAPVKNAPGSASDSPDTARVYISNQAKRWVTSSGGALTGDDDNSTKEEVICEIAPLTSYGGEGLETAVSGKELACPFSL